MMPAASRAEPIRVVIVDDSAFMRMALRRIIEAEGDLLVVGEAADGEAAVEAVRRHNPAVVAMDVEMPVLGGIEATRRIMALPNPPAVVMVSQHTQDHSPAALAALEAGASDYVSKDTGLGGVDLGHLDRALRARLRHWARAQASSAHVPPPGQAPDERQMGAAPRLILVAASTGGPDALAALLKASGPLPVPVVIAQHMPASLAPELAALLARRAGWPVRVAADDRPLRAGEATLLPTDGVLLRAGDGLRLRLTPGGTLVHPSADLLFRSAAVAGVAAAGVVLTGMGTDGAQGAAALAGAGGRILVQSAASAVVSGMPDAARAQVPEAEVMTPAELGARLRRWWGA
jgi:two-component system chemotaxis response regulator CheB